MADARGCGSDGDRAIARVQVRAVGHEEDRLDPGERGRERRTRLLEVADVDVDSVAEERLRLLRVAHEHAWPFAASEQAPDDARPDGPGRAEDQRLHRASLQPWITSSANRF